MDKPVSLATNAKTISKLVVTLNMQHRVDAAIKTTKSEFEVLQAVEDQKIDETDPADEFEEMKELLTTYEDQSKRLTGDVESTSLLVIKNLNSVLGKKKGTLSRIITIYEQ